MSSTIYPTPRLRLAPSPTGFLHLGNFRTALFTYLLAKKWGGEVILRIEDTDTEREVAGAVDSLLNVLNTMGITFSEGPHCGGSHAPYIQSQRLQLYQTYAHELIKTKAAYYCFATPEELANMRAEQAARHEPPRYDRRYRDLPEQEVKKLLEAHTPYVIRQAMPLKGDITVHDELRGDITFAADQLEDHVLLKSDGGATYQLASVVDDHVMKITHVTRGDEWLPSLPKNILLYQAFGWEAPKFIHFPLILNKGGGKLSKRQGDVFVEDYLTKGYLPDALINFCALLGWHPKDNREFFRLEELEQIFDLNGIGVSPAIFDQDKLDSVNSHYIREAKISDLLPLAKPFFEPLLATASDRQKSDEYISAILKLEQPRIKNFTELATNTDFFFASDLTYDQELLIWKKNTRLITKEYLQELLEILQGISEDDWEQGELERMIITYLQADNKSLGDYLWPLRVALSGKKASPSPFEIMGIIKKTETLARINQAIRLLE